VSRRRRFLAPEVVQTSAMDCGPAALKALLEGFGIPTSYGRLREACQTEVDGSSIDTLEDIANRLGLLAEQVMVPVDSLLLDSTAALPAIVVVRAGATAGNHFVVLWRKVGPFVQVMDPETGRRWMRVHEFLRDVYVHSMPVPADAVREWLASDDTAATFTERARLLNAWSALSEMLESARKDGSLERLAELDAALRLAEALVRARSIDRGAAAARLIAVTCERLRSGDTGAVPERFWAVKPGAPDEDGTKRVTLVGAVLVKVSGRRTREQTTTDTAPLPAELAAAVGETPVSSTRELWKALRHEGRVPTIAVVAATLAIAAGSGLEVVMLRALFNVGRALPVVEQRLLGFAAVLFVSLVLLGFEVPLAALVLRLGRGLELRLRVAFLEKLPRLGDRYMQSRPPSDMAERSHSLHTLRHLPEVAGQLVRVLFDLAAAIAGLVWLDPSGAFFTVALMLCMLVAAVVLQERIGEHDLRFRSLAGGLTRFYLDALLGHSPVKSHAAERAVQHEHERQLVEWWRTGLALTRASVSAEGISFLVGSMAGGAFLLRALSREPDGRVLLLLLYWALSLPGLAQELAVVVRRFPMHRSLTLRLLEPMGALEEHPEGNAAPASPAPRASVPSNDGGVAIRLSEVTVRAGGHVLLSDVTLTIPGGQHVAIVGPSGAGKSSLAGLLLGFHRASAGEVLIDGETLSGERLARLRRECAWLDPQVQLWNRTLLENLLYGSGGGGASQLDEVVRATELSSVLRRMPDGLQSSLGEGGALVSGGEGQRVRLARALLRPASRLVIMDEAFRGLGREMRRTLLERARAFWKGATLIAVTHDVEHALSFDRVLVLEHGAVVEDGAPGALANDATSRFRFLMDAEAALATEIAETSGLKPMRLENGRVSMGVQ
jgi:ATP-binding cassette subfamily B protein